jgi:macrodomain Ter protein organizer (MatP/YcbG family)
MTLATNLPVSSNGHVTAQKLLHLNQRHPRRISITISHVVYELLVERSHEEGRSMSNLCAYLLEDSVRPDLSAQRSSA